MRILFVTNNYTPYSGGVVSSINSFVHALRARGHEVFIVTLNFVNDRHDTPAYVYRIPCPIKFRFHGNPLAVPWRPTAHIYSLICSLKPDIVHVHHPFLLGVSGLKAARKAKLPVVFTYHTIYEEYLHYVPLPQWLTRPIMQRRVRNFCARVDGVIAPSSMLEKKIQSLCQTPVAIIPSPLRSLFLAEPPRLEEKPNNEPFELLVVSRLVKEKSIEKSLDLFAQLEGNYRLSIIGYGYAQDALKQYAYETLQLSPERVRFLGKKNQEELVHYYRNADLFIFTSHTDTQGIVLAEAMAGGTPVLALDGPGQKDIVRNGVNGYLCTSVEEMANYVARIAHDKNLAHALRMGARETAQNYSAPVLTQKLITFYEKIMALTRRA